MSEFGQLSETIRLVFRWTKIGVISEVTPAPTATIYAPDGTSSSLTLTLQGSGTTARYIGDFVQASAGIYEVLATTSDAAVDAATYQEFVRVGQTWITRIDAAISSAGGATATAIWDYLTSAANVVGSMGAFIVQKLGLVGAGDITVIAPVDAATANVSVIRGDTYAATESRLLAWTSTDWTPYDLSTATLIQFRAKARNSTTVFTKTATAVSDTLVQCALTSAETATFPVGQSAMNYDLQATLLSGSIVTLALGKVNVTEDVI